MDLNRATARRQANLLGTPQIPVNSTVLAAVMRDQGLVALGLGTHDQQDFGEEHPPFWANHNVGGNAPTTTAMMVGVDNPTTQDEGICSAPSPCAFVNAGGGGTYAKLPPKLDLEFGEKDSNVDVASEQYVELMERQDAVKPDKLLAQDRWKHATDTEWHLVRLRNKAEVEAVKAALAGLRRAQREEEDSAGERRDGNKHGSKEDLEDDGDDEVQVIKFLTLRYEEPENDKVFKDRRKCEGMDQRNASRFIINSKLVNLVGQLILLPLYQKQQKVPVPLEYGPMAKERWAAYCSAPEVQLRMAIKYLYKRGKVAQRDYKIKQAVDAANEIAFEEAVEREIARYRASERDGMVPVRIRGQRPARWNGRDPTDSRGVHIRWARKKGFSFIRDDLIDIEHYKPSAKVVVSDKC